MKMLRFNALVLETIERCNAKCSMCYQAAGPKGSDIRGDSKLPLHVIKDVIEQAASIEELSGSRVHVSGGEAFLRYEELLQIFQSATDVGFHDVGSTTNAFWAINPEQARRRCDQLAGAGVSYLEVSMDYWHLPYVPLQRVRNLLPAARAVGIRIMLRTLSSRSHHMDELFEEFDDSELMQVQIGNSTVAPVGRGRETLSASDVYGESVSGACCETMLNLTISPNGNVYPCCAGADMTESLSSGNVHVDRLADAVLRMRTDQMIRHLIHQGPSSLLPILNKLGLSDRLKSSHSSICHLCWDIFRQDDVSAALREHFAGEQFDLIVNILGLQNKNPHEIQGAAPFS
jgi:MoaA/NifB/PqqE/SkfB family radical SAM enzyme